MSTPKSTGTKGGAQPHPQHPQVAGSGSSDTPVGGAQNLSKGSAPTDGGKTPTPVTSSGSGAGATAGASAGGGDSDHVTPSKSSSVVASASATMQRQTAQSHTSAQGVLYSVK